MPVGFVTSQLLAQRSGPRLPTGTVTFLLTDIEGSTGLLRRLGDGYAGLLRNVRRLIDESVTSAAGHKVDAHGDEYFGVFSAPADAVGAAVAMQRATPLTHGLSRLRFAYGAASTVGGRN